MAVELQRYQRQVTPRNTARVVKIARGNNAAEQFGRTVTGVANEYDAFQDSLETARSQSELVRAETEARKKYDSLYRSLEADGDGDYSQFEARLKEGASKINNEISGQFKTDKARQAWGESMAPQMQTDWTLKTRGLQRRKAVDEVKATAAYKADDLQSLADDISIPASRLLEERAKLDSFVAMQSRKGLFDDVQVEAFRQKADAIQTAAVDKRHKSEIDLRLGSGQTASALAYAREHYSELDPAKRDDYMTAVEQKAKGIDAFNKADSIYSGPENYKQVLGQAQKIEDAEERMMVQDRIVERTTMDLKFRAVEQQANETKALNHVLAGGNINDMPTDVRAGSSPSWILRLNSLSGSGAGGSGLTKDESEITRRNLLTTMNNNPDLLRMDPDQWPEAFQKEVDSLSKLDAAKFYESVSEGKNTLLSDEADSREKAISTDAIDDNLQRVLDGIELYMPQELDLDDYRFDDKEGLSDNERKVRVDLLNKVRRWSLEEGEREIPDDVRMRWIGEAFGKLTRREGWGPFGKTVPVRNPYASLPMRPEDIPERPLVYAPEE